MSVERFLLFVAMFLLASMMYHINTATNKFPYILFSIIVFLGCVIGMVYLIILSVL